MTPDWHRLQAPLRFQIETGDTTVAMAGATAAALRLQLAGLHQLMVLQRVFRVLPGKRLVGLVQINDTLMIAKLFFEPGRWPQHLQREIDGIRRMQDKQVPTAALLFSGRFAALQGEETLAATGGLLLLDYLPGSGLDAAWQGAPDPRELVFRALSLIAYCHHNGLLQHDIHLDNFHVSNERLYLLDAADVGAVAPQSPLVLDNLALFLAQFPVHNDVWLDDYGRHYSVARAELGEAMHVQNLSARVGRARLARWRVIEKKLFRETSAHACARSWSRFVVYDRKQESLALQQFIANPDAAIAAGRLLKDGNSATVVEISLDGQAYIVKRYNMKSLGHWLRRTLRPSRAWVSWRNAHLLQMFGIRTPRPVLLMEERFGPLRSRAWILTEKVEGQDALQWLRDESLDGSRWQAILPHFRELFRVMRDYHLVHGDMKATNFIAGPEGLVVLDLDAMGLEENASRFQQRFEQEKKRFARNWQDGEAVLTQVIGQV